MDKTCMVYREMAERALKDRRARIIGREVSKALGISPDTVSSALAPLKRIGAVKVYRRYSEVVAFKKLLLFWAVNRKFRRDLVYSTYAVAREPGEIEDRMPDEVAFTNYSGYTKAFGANDATDYGDVYIYASGEALEEIKRRFPKGRISQRVEGSNLFVLAPDRVLEERINRHDLYRSSVSLPQLYADLWNVEGWIANVFLKKTEARIDEMYEKAILE